MYQFFLLFPCADQDVAVYKPPGEGLIIAEVRAIVPVEAADCEQILDFEEAHECDSLLGHRVLQQA